MADVKHDIWRDRYGLTMLCFSGELGLEARTLLEPGSELIHSFYASSHFDAMTKYYEFMNWGIYETEHESDRIPYLKSELINRAMFRLEIDTILWEDWDPIGVNGMAPRDEYQNYVPQILNLVMQGYSSEEIADRLHEIETSYIGLKGDLIKCKEVANKIIAKTTNPEG